MENVYCAEQKLNILFQFNIFVNLKILLAALHSHPQQPRLIALLNTSIKQIIAIIIPASQQLLLKQSNCWEAGITLGVMYNISWERKGIIPIFLIYVICFF